jgi:hypothetical protein
MLARRSDGSSCLCFCASRDLTAAVGWTGASESYERERLAELGRQVLGEHQQLRRRSCRNPDHQER